MWSKQFFKLAERIGVTPSAATKLWDVLSDQDTSHADENQRNADLAEGLTEDMFVQHLLRWTPNTAVDALRKEMIARFPSFVDARKALRRQGFPGSVVLSPRRFRQGLRQIGIMQADTDIVLSKVRALRGRQIQHLRTKGGSFRTRGETNPSEVTLDEVFEYMNNAILLNSRSNVVEHELSALRYGLQRVRADQAQRKVAVTYATPNGEPPSTDLPPVVVDDGTKFTALPGEEETLHQKTTLF